MTSRLKAQNSAGLMNHEMPLKTRLLGFRISEEFASASLLRSLVFPFQ